MSHQPSVSDTYYKAITGPRDAANAFIKMEKLRTDNKETTEGEAAAEGNKKWSERDAKTVERHFRNNILRAKAPILKECTADHIQIPGKSARQIKDKIRTIIRQQNRAL